MKPFVHSTLMRQRARLHELDSLLAAPDVVDNMDRFRALSKEHAEASSITEVFNRFLQREEDLKTAEEMLNDPDMAEMARARKLLAKGESVDAVLEALSRGLTQKMLHGTLAELRSGDAQSRAATAQTVSRLFLRDDAGKPPRQS